MSFWDHIKPTAPPPVATDVRLSSDAKSLSLTWSDGVTTHVSARTLRQQCPCAECVDEWTRQRTLDPAKVPENLTVLEVRPVGNYAIAFQFADAHATGIYTWRLLRELSSPA